MLTTMDNPYSPFDQFDLWWLFDIEKRHFSCELLGKIVQIEDDMSDKEKKDAMDRAIDEIIKNDQRGIFARATEDNPVPGFPN